MRTIRFTTRFKKDYRRKRVGKHGKILDKVLTEVIDLLGHFAIRPKHHRNVIPGDPGSGPGKARDPRISVPVGPGARDAYASLGRDDNRD